MLKLIDCISSEGMYNSAHWKYEDTYKYVFDLNDNIIEAGFFIHYKDCEKKDCEKYVIELPTSYGCPIRCKFCASCNIKYNGIIGINELFQVFAYIYEHNGLQDNNNVRVSYLGIGDLYYTIDNVLEVSEMINKCHSNIQYNLSSCLWNEQMFRKISNSSIKKNIKNLQITYVSHKTAILRNVIPVFFNQDISFHKINDSIIKYDFICCRINYIMINGINDSIKDFFEFIDLFQRVKERIVVRISKLNETEASISNRIRPASSEKMRQFYLILKDNGFNSYLFYSYKNDNMNCGQLINEHQHKN